MYIFLHCGSNDGPFLSTDHCVHAGLIPLFYIPVQLHDTIINPFSANHSCSRQHFETFIFYFTDKTSLDISCESSSKQMIHMKCQDLFSLKNKTHIKKIENVVCCKFAWRFKG